MEFVIKSNNSDRELVFSNFVTGDYIDVAIRGAELNAKISSVYLYTGASGLSRMFQDLGQQEKPWSNPEVFKSIEEDFYMDITCNSRGHVRFRIILQKVDHLDPEGMYVSAGLTVDLGAMASIANDAQKFFDSNSRKT